MNSGTKLCILIAVIVACIQVGYIATFHPPLNWYDSAIYDAEAWNFVQGLGFSLTPGIPDALREPGYSLFVLAPVYALFGHDIIAAQLAQVLLVSLTSVLIYYIGNRYLHRTAGLIAAALYGLYPPVVVYSGEIMTEILFTFLFTTFLLALLLAVEKKQWWWFALAGVLLGLTTLTRFLTILLPVVIVVGFIFMFRQWLPQRRHTIIASAIFVLAFLTTISPWLIRNYITFDRFIVGRTGGGEMYWTGSYIPWDGDWQGYVWPITTLNQADSVSASDTKMTELAIANIKADPLGVALIWLKKPLKIYFQPEGTGLLLQHGAFAGSTALSILLIIAYLGHTFILGCAALGLLRWRRFQLFFSVTIPILGYLVFIYLPLNAVPRYAIPAFPVLFLLAGIAITELGQDLQKRYATQRP